VNDHALPERRRGARGPLVVIQRLLGHVNLGLTARMPLPHMRSSFALLAVEGESIGACRHAHIDLGLHRGRE
jgi:hypothetical protein